MSENRLMAFWNYDQFPYTLHGEVDKFEDKPEVVRVKNYGGSAFKYRHICSYAHGEFVAKSLEALEADFKKESKELSKKYHSALKGILDQSGVPLPTNISVFK